VINKRQEQQIGEVQPLKDLDTTKDHPDSTLGICNLLLPRGKQGTAQAETVLRRQVTGFDQKY
jgi:hypothetical protein